MKRKQKIENIEVQIISIEQWYIIETYAVIVLFYICALSYSHH